MLLSLLCMFLFYILCFFFKQKTAYEMRISDWSSDVCSSDLQILVFDKGFNILEGEPAKVSRESRMHFACYQHFPQVNGVIHAHPQYLTVFASAGETDRKSVV